VTAARVRTTRYYKYTRRVFLIIGTKPNEPRTVKSRSRVIPYTRGRREYRVSERPSCPSSATYNAKSKRPRPLYTDVNDMSDGLSPVIRSRTKYHQTYGGERGETQTNAVHSRFKPPPVDPVDNDVRASFRRRSSCNRVTIFDFCIRLTVRNGSVVSLPPSRTNGSIEHRRLPTILTRGRRIRT